MVGNDVCGRVKVNFMVGNDDVGEYVKLVLAMIVAGCMLSSGWQ